MQHIQGKFRGTRGTEIYYQAWDPVDPMRAVIVGIHGLGDHSGGLYTIVKHLLPKEYAWYGFDLRGHGQSPGLRGHVDKWSDIQGDLKAFFYRVKERNPVRPIFLIGHSLGGLICLDYAIHNPDGLKGIIAISPLLEYSGLSPALKLFLRGIAFVKSDFIFKGTTDTAKLTRDAGIGKILENDPLRHGRMSAGFWREIDTCRRWVRAHGCDLKVPLLILYGLNDQITPARAIRQFFRSVSFCEKHHYEYEDSRHRPFDDVNRGEVLGHIATWLKKRTSASGCLV